LSDGTSNRITLSSRRLVSASSAVASACAHSIAIWLDPISVEWMLQVTTTMTLPSRTRRSSSAALRPRGSASRRATVFQRSRSRRFVSEEITAISISSPRVVLPSTSIATRGDPAAR
jgi:hypothetical protein